MIIVLRNKRKPKITTCGGVYSRVVKGVTMLYTEDGMMRERKVGGNILYSLPNSGEWEHPWFTRVMWSETLKDRFTGKPTPGFAAVVKPGFLNGLDPVCPAAEEIEVYSPEDEQAGPGEVQMGQPGLLDEPLIPLNGSDSWKRADSMPYRVRKYFETIGVSQADFMSLKGQTLVINETKGNMFQQMGAKSTLLKTDLYLAVARPTLKTQQVAFSDGYGTPLFDYNVSFDNTALINFPRPRLLAGENPRQAGKGADSTGLGGAGRGDEGVDYVGIATVYAASPKDWEAPEDSRVRITPDEAWRIFVSYEAFWNLDYRSRELQPMNFKSMTVGPIMGGLGGSLIAPAVAAANMAMNSGNKMMSDALNSQTNEGVFWSV